MTFSLNVDSWIESVDYKMPAAAQRDLVLIDIVKYAQWLHDTCTDGTRPDASIEEQREYCVVSNLFDMPYTSSLLFTYIYVMYIRTCGGRMLQSWSTRKVSRKSSSSIWHPEVIKFHQDCCRTSSSTSLTAIEMGSTRRCPGIFSTRGWVGTK